MRKYAIYTTIVGGYDSVKQPIVIDDRFDYILFTDDVSKTRIGVWEVRSIPFADEDSLRLSRYTKILPIIVLPEYNASLYIDGTLQITSSYVYERFFELYEQKVDWAGVRHHYRDCAYDEMCGIVGEFPKNVHDYETIEWYAKLKKEGFPEHWGLYENNVIFRIHNSIVAEICQEWWGSLTQYCRRDQFSLMYILWKKSPRHVLFLPSGDDAKHSSHFKYHIHTYLRKQTRKTFNEKVRISCWHVSPWKTQWYGYVMEHAYKLTPWPRFSLVMWEYYAIHKFWIPYMAKQAVKKIFSTSVV